MVYCLFTLTIGQFIPVYFKDKDLRGIYYLIILILTSITTTIVIFKRFYKPQKDNIYISCLSAFIIGLGTVLTFMILGFLSSLAVWTDAGTIYTNKKDPQLKIVSRYLNEGAFGGGTEAGDYEIVLKRQITSFLKIETSIDTNKINRNEWIKKVYNKYNTIYDDPNQ